MSKAFFSIIPVTAAAALIVDDHKNRLNRHRLRIGENGTLKTGLQIRRNPDRASDRYNLAIIGRDEQVADIYAEGSTLSRIHCSFDIADVEGLSVLVLCDRSLNRSMIVRTEDGSRFPSEGPRFIELKPYTKVRFGLDAAASDSMYFDIIWEDFRKIDWQQELVHRDTIPTRRLTIMRPRSSIARQEQQSENGRTLRITPAVSPEKLIVTTSLNSDNILGQGGQGSVFKAKVKDGKGAIENGKIVAVKVVKKPSIDHPAHRYLKREVQWLDSIKHEHLAKMWKCQLHPADRDFPYEHYRIYLHAMEGNIGRLFSGRECKGDQYHVRELAIQMTDALGYLETHIKGIHRDVKPGNILYRSFDQPKSLRKSFHYVLTDFGFCTSLASARSYHVGTRHFIAPEVMFEEQGPYSNTADIWSLFVTLAWCMNVVDFQNRTSQNLSWPEIRDLVRVAANYPAMHPYRKMAHEDPLSRPTASQLFRKLNRTTRQNSDTIMEDVLDARPHKGEMSRDDQRHLQSERRQQSRPDMFEKSINSQNTSSSRSYQAGLSRQMPDARGPYPPPEPLSRSNQRSKFSFSRTNTNSPSALQERDQNRVAGRAKFSFFGKT